MNDDQIQSGMREILWRRNLTDAERNELLARLAAQPAARRDFELESALNAALSKLPQSNVPSNFTARLLERVELEERRGNRRTGWAGWTWRRLVPRIAVAVAVIGLTGLTYHFYRFNREAGVVHQLARVSAGQPGPEVLKDFDAIRRLSRTAPHADTALLALMQ